MKKSFFINIKIAGFLKPSKMVLHAVAKPGLKGWSCTYFSMQSIQLWYQYKGQDYFSKSAKCPKYHKNKAKLNTFCGI